MADKEKKKGLMEKLFKSVGRVKDEGVKKGKPSIWEQAGRNRKKKKKSGY